MFSVSTSAQVTSQHLIIPVSYIASLVTRSRNTNQRCKHSTSLLQHPDEVILCRESFENALRSVQSLLDLGFLDLTVSRKVQPAHLSIKKSLPWVDSHVSTPTFYQNKLLSNYDRSRLLVSYRGFRSRSFPSVGLGTDPGKLEAISTSASESQKIKVLTLGKQSSENELKELLTNASPEEQTKMRVAFAEGYLAAGKKTRPRWFVVFKELLSMALVLTLLFVFLGDLTGGTSFRKVLIGSGYEVHPEEIDVTFNDVKGVEEAKQELQEVVEFLKDPSRFSVLGGKLPKGVLLVGPPGTGKTLLARAVAGEAGVPFFHAAGPEFEEILVGQGARRVRDLFATAKLQAPCVIFIDEIDSVGAKRSNSVIHPYANQTINQLLTEMDGFRQNEGVVVLGATNRRDDLDKALLRPGRFDVEVQVPTPDLKGRVEIFDLYLGKVKRAPEVNVEALARQTTGFTGADIENMVNQAALRAAIEGATSVKMIHLENSRDKIIMGPERKSRIPDEESNNITAYHEGGHALVAHYTKQSHPLHKITIVSRGSTLGHTAFIPEKDSYHVTKAQFMAQLDVCMGGRVAEELVFGEDKITSGASSDLKNATAIATHMVRQFGMSEKVGVRTFDEEPGGLVVVNELSPKTSELIDEEIKRLLQESYERAKSLLKTRSKELKLLAEALLKYETLDAEEVKLILEGKDIKRLKR